MHRERVGVSNEGARNMVRGQRLRHTAPVKRGFLTATVLLVVLAIAAACTPPAPRGAFAVPPAACTDVVLVTARGSSQEVDSDETRSVHRRFREALAAQAPGRSVRILELGDLDGDAAADPGGYPAFGFDRILGVDLTSDPVNDFAVTGGYNESRRVGSAEVASVIDQVTTACPDARLVVVGTSMGADAVAQGLPNVPNEQLERIDALHLFGDPRFMVGPWARAPRAWIPSGHGLLGVRAPYVPPALAPRTVSWCGEFDGTCTAQWHMSIFQLLPFCEQLRQFAWCSTRHTDYDFWAHQSAMAEAVGAVVRRAGWQPAT